MSMKTDVKKKPIANPLKEEWKKCLRKIEYYDALSGDPKVWERPVGLKNFQ